MPYFRYSGIGSDGAPVKGTIQAADEAGARSSLARGGVRNIAFGEAPPRTPPPVASRPAAARPLSSARPAAPSAPAPVSASAPRPIATPAASPANRKRANSVNQHLLYFTFTQMGSQFKAGVNPALGLPEIAKGVRNRPLKEAIERMAEAAKRGGSLADAMDESPGVFPVGAAGTVRAAEASGRVPEAFQLLAQQSSDARVLARAFLWPTLYLVIIATLIPILFGVVNGAMLALRRQDAAGGTLPRRAIVVQSIGETLPAFLGYAAAIFGALLILNFVWKSGPLASVRHHLARRTPLVGKLLEAESYERMAWAMRCSAEAGLPPARGVELAIEAIPSLPIQNRMRHAIGQLDERTSYADALTGAGSFDPMTLAMVRNAQLTGDIPGALAEVAHAQRANIPSLQKIAGAITYLTITLVTGAMVTVAVYFLYKIYVSGLMSIVGE